MSRLEAEATWVARAPAHRAMAERRPSAPMTRSALASRRAAPARPVIPVTRPARSRRRPVTEAPNRTSAPALRAASARIASRTLRRGAYSASTPCLGLIGTVVTASGRWKVVDRTAGVPAPTTPGSNPHRCSCTTAPRMSAWVDSVSVPYRDLSSTSTRAPCLASSSAVAAPAQRAPAMTTL